MENLFLHVDMNNFYASVECRERPELQNLPVAVAGDPDKRHGVVLAKNQLAKMAGVKTGDTIWEARSKTPDIVFLPPNFPLYDKISKQFFDICNDFTCYVEPFGPDECWLDCTQTQKLFDSGENIANRLRARIKSELGITASVGVSFTKMFAKLGSDMKKPDGTTVITKDNFKELVWKLPIEDLCGVGRKTKIKLNKINIYNIGELAASDYRVIKNLLGKNGLDLRAIAQGENIGDVREAVVEREVKSIGHGLTALKDLTTFEEFTTLIYYLSELIAARLRKANFTARGLHLGLRTSTLRHYGKQMLLDIPVNSSSDIGNAAIALFKTIYDGAPLRSIHISTFMLSSPPDGEQLSFKDLEAYSTSAFTPSKATNNTNLDIAIQRLRAKYGKQSVLRACHLTQDVFMDKDMGDFLPFKR